MDQTKSIELQKKRLESAEERAIVQQPKAIYLAKPVSSDKVFFSADYISFGCL